MSDTTFVSKTTVIATAWCQDVNNVIYRILGTGVGGTAPQSASDVRTNLGISTSGTSVLKGNGTGWIANSKVALTEPATGCTITVADGKTLTCSNNITLAGTDGSTTGTAAFLNVGTAAHNVVQLDASAKLPAVDGSALTNLPGVATAGIQCGFRLSLQTATPVPTSDITAATTIYMTPYMGNKISLYFGGQWVVYSTAEISIALGTLVIGTLYDVFCYSNAGTPTLELGPAWTNSGAGTSSRSTALMFQDGVYVKNGDATRRYMGTFLTDTTTTTKDTKASRYLWNMYNRVNRFFFRGETTPSWTWSTSSYQRANNSAANTLEIITGLAEDSPHLTVRSEVATSTGTVHELRNSIGLNSTTAPAGYLETSKINVSNVQGRTTFGSTSSFPPALGYNIYEWLEFGGGADVQTWYSDTSGISGVMRM